MKRSAVVGQKNVWNDRADFHPIPDMARHNHIDTSPRLLAVDLERQLLPGSLDHALNYLIGHERDLSGFDVHYRNDQTGAPTYRQRAVAAINNVPLQH